ncbi:MAG: acetyl-CoA carboxylase biotin carboxyl carrier protein [Pseudomonadota bacterium]
MDLRKIKKLIELVEEAGISELEVTSGDESVRIARHAPSGIAAAPVSVPAAAREPAPATSDLVVRAPMAGTFYAAPDPDAAPFVVAGAAIEGDAFVCIIESMKMMNEIRAPAAGVCSEVLVGNGEPVAAGQALLRLHPAAGSAQEDG